MDRLCFTHAVKEKMDRLLDTTRGKGKNGQIDRLCFTQAVAQNGQTVLYTSCVAKDKNGQMDRLCFTQAVAKEKWTDGQTMLHTSRGPEWTDCASH